MIYYTIYKITNLINDKIYIGAHKTSDLDDGYMGSGKVIKLAINKYGKENFEKEILKVCDSINTMFEMESIIVNQDFIKLNGNYNLVVGGLNSSEGGKASKMFYDANPLELEKKKHQLKSVTTFESCSKGGKNSPGFISKKHSDESKKKMSEKAKIHSKGEKNSQFGSMWIYNLEEKLSKKIKKEDFSEWKAKGWLKGRIDFKVAEKRQNIREFNLNIKKEKEDQLKNETIEVFKNYVESEYTSLNKFCKAELDFSLVTLTKRFKKYIIGYDEISSQGAQNLKEEFRKFL